MTVLALNLFIRNLIFWIWFIVIISKLIIIEIKELIILARIGPSGSWLIVCAAWSNWRVFMFHILHWFSLFFLFCKFIVKYVIKIILLISEVIFHIYWIYLGAWQIIYKSLFLPILLFLISRVALAYFILFFIILDKFIIF